jgi:hypothetical protein
MISQPCCCYLLGVVIFRGLYTLAGLGWVSEKIQGTFGEGTKEQNW